MHLTCKPRIQHQKRPATLSMERIERMQRSATSLRQTHGMESFDLQKDLRVPAP
jgi:hypothetical protein